jgi:hypothetical protein
MRNNVTIRVFVGKCYPRSPSPARLPGKAVRLSERILLARIPEEGNGGD